MSGSLAGHTAAWPLPNVANSALHAALWRAGFADKVHAHRPGKSGQIQSENRAGQGELFGSLVTAGPFPVLDRSPQAPLWFFPRPLDAGSASKVQYLPVNPAVDTSGSHSIQHGLRMAVGNLANPTKEKPAAWWCRAAWDSYLNGNPITQDPSFPHTLNDADFSDTEHNIGIGIDPTTGAQDGQSFYSAHYLRLRDNWRLGLFAKAEDKEYPEYKVQEGKGDLIQGLFAGSSHNIIIGGQQRVCSASLIKACGDRLPLPMGLSKESEFKSSLIEGQKKFLVKWVLLTPAVWPEIEEGISARDRRPVVSHPGGWLPNWVDASTKQVLLRSISPAERRERRTLNYAGKGYASERNAEAIHATLVAAIVPKPITVSGWSLGSKLDESQSAKPTHLAVAAGSVYYFACDTAADARALALALNWHGDSNGSEIRRRRSTLLGEKGFGLGVCGTWTPHT